METFVTLLFLILRCCILQVFMVRTIGYTWWYWSGNPSFNVMYFIIVLWLHCFILQVVMVRINWIHMVRWSGNPSFDVMFCFHVVLLLFLLYHFTVSFYRLSWWRLIGCTWYVNQAICHLMWCYCVSMFYYFAVVSLHCFILQVIIVRINWMHMICWSGDPSFNVMLCFVLFYYFIQQDWGNQHFISQAGIQLWYCFNCSNNVCAQSTH